MLIVAGVIKIDPAKRTLAEAAFAKVRAATLEESGCIEYQAYADPSDPAVVFMFEKWQSADALAKHFQTPHMAEFGAAIGALGVTGSDLTKYQISSSGPLR